MEVHDLASRGIGPTSASGFFRQSGTAHQTSMNDNVLPRLPISAARNNVDTSAMLKPGICRNFWSTGTCRFGDKCAFAHGSQELRKSKMTNHNTLKRRICRFSMEKCPYGEKCIFPHERSKVCEEKGNMPWKNYESNIQPGNVDSRSKTRRLNNRMMLNTCNYSSESSDAQGLAELRRSAPIVVVSESGNARIAPTALVKDALPDHSQTPTAMVYKLPPRVCILKRIRKKKVIGIYADWIDEESFASLLSW